MLRSANFERFERFPTAAKYGQVSEQNLRTTMSNLFLSLFHWY